MNPVSEENLKVIMSVIMHSGNAKGQAFQAIQLAKEGQFVAADAKMKTADEELKKAHHVQTDLLTKAAGGEHIEVDLYMAHAQDHLMTAITFKDLAIEIVGLEKRLQQLENK